MTFIDKLPSFTYADGQWSSPISPCQRFNISILLACIPQSCSKWERQPKSLRLLLLFWIDKYESLFQSHALKYNTLLFYSIAIRLGGVLRWRRLKVLHQVSTIDKTRTNITIFYSNGLLFDGLVMIIMKWKSGGSGCWLVNITRFVFAYGQRSRSALTFPFALTKEWRWCHLIYKIWCYLLLLGRTFIFRAQKLSLENEWKCKMFFLNIL